MSHIGSLEAGSRHDLRIGLSPDAPDATCRVDRSTSRSTASSAGTRELLSWIPTGPSLVEDILAGAYAED